MISGICRVCGCTQTTPCIVGGMPCKWVDVDRTLCSNFRCLAVIQLDELLAMLEMQSAIALMEEALRAS